MEDKQVPPIRVKVSDMDPGYESKFNSREASAQPVKLELKPSRRKTKGSPDSTTAAAAAAVAANGSSAAASKKLNTPPMSNSPAAGATKGSTAYERSVNGSRITMHSNLVPTETQDVSWSEIDTLDDVKNMAKEPIINDGFPPDFENRLTQMRRSHAQLLRVMRERNERLKHAKPELSRMPAPAAEKGQRGAAAKGPVRGRERERPVDDPELAFDGEKYVGQIVDTIKRLDL
ncbi:hypothetical protein N7582_001279 [Saccharomyces uvarum]|uniref:Uncharacterized protein n=1 Tax=Saccharomyces uvarum TaxID=230603 RepID=A0AA35JF44_SACUV|nr:hypothetical protein N7582_001279 [Saccharomyces uvarum]CAI4059075.1 hypothetical protein SUVC_04G4120 [Saccharomyces uvarum]